MNWREFETWQVYNALYPLGERRADLRAGVIAATIANVNRGPDTPAYGPWDIMPSFDAVDEEEVDDEASIALTQAVFESLATQLGGTIQG